MKIVQLGSQNLNNNFSIGKYVILPHFQGGDTMTNTKILILCQDDAHHKYLISYLEQRHIVSSAIIESRKSARLKLLKKKKYVKFFWAEYHAIRRIVQGTNKYRKSFFGNIKFNSLKSQLIFVDDINSNTAVKEIKTQKPGVIVVMGTSILHKEILESANKSLIINIHGGYLPYYKGNHCFFFALLNRDYDKIGSTIHFIDKGIDTGPIICHIMPHKTREDNAESLYCKADMGAIKKLDLILKDFESGKKINSKKQTEIGKQYYTSDRKPYHEIIMLYRKITNSVFQ